MLVDELISKRVDKLYGNIFDGYVVLLISE